MGDINVRLQAMHDVLLVKKFALHTHLALRIVLLVSVHVQFKMLADPDGETLFNGHEAQCELLT
jgi:hypothetical protein